MSRKGISPIIASVLLVAVTLSVVGVFSGWAPQLANTITDETSNSTLETIECDQASLEIRSAFYNSSASDTTVAIRNNGNTDLPEISLTAFNQNDVLIDDKAGINLSSGEIQDETLTNTDEEPDYLEAFSQSCGDISYRFEDVSR